MYKASKQTDFNTKAVLTGSEPFSLLISDGDFKYTKLDKFLDC